jgi:hypothetical protein
MGMKHITVLVGRRADDLRAEIGDGERWGIETKLVSVARELTVEEARAKFGPADEVVVADCLPGLPNQQLFGSYTQFFAGVQKAFFTLAPRGRVGAREIQPGVWVGLRTHIGADATFEAPCWLGEDVHVEKDAHLGPWAILEDRVWVGAGAEVVQSVIGAETSLGVATSLKNSIAFGSTLINWQTNSIATVADSFLLCGLRATPFKQRIRRIFARLAEKPEPIDSDPPMAMAISEPEPVGQV